MADSTLQLLFKIKTDSSDATRELLDVQRAVREIVRQSNVEAGKLGAGFDGGSIRAQLLSGLGDVRQLFAGLAESAQAEVAGARQALKGLTTGLDAPDLKDTFAGLSESAAAEVAKARAALKGLTTGLDAKARKDFFAGLAEGAQSEVVKARQALRGLTAGLDANGLKEFFEGFSEGAAAEVARAREVLKGLTSGGDADGLKDFFDGLAEGAAEEVAKARETLKGLTVGLNPEGLKDFFAGLAAGAEQETERAREALRGLGDAGEEAGAGLKKGASDALALARVTAQLQVAEGDAAGAVKTLKDALSGVTEESVATIRARIQLVGIEAQLASASGKAEAAMLREAQALARIKQQSGDAAGAIRILDEAIKKASNPQSLAALRAQLQKTYLDTNYANSPLIGAIRQSNQAINQLFNNLHSGLAGLRSGDFGQATEGLLSLAIILPKLRGGASGAAAGLATLGGSAGAAAGGIGLAVTGLVALTAAAIAAEVAVLKLAIANAQELAPLDRLAERTGIAEAGLFKLKVAAESVGVGFETVIEQIDFFNSNLAKAAGGDKLSQKLKQFGIDAKEAANAPGAAFDELAQKIGKIENPVQRMAAVTTFFGEEGRKLVPVFIDLARNADRYRDVLDRLGGAEGVRRIIQSSAELDKELKRLGGEFKVLQLLVTREVVPALVVAIRQVIPILRELAPVFTLVGKAAVGGLLTAVAVLKTAAQQARDLKQAVVELASGEFAKAGASLGLAFARSVTLNLLDLRRQLAAVGTGKDSPFGNFQPPPDDKKTGQDDAARERLRQLEDELKEEESILRFGNDRLKRQFEQRLIDEAEYTDSLVRAAVLRRSLALDKLQEEREVITNSRLDPADKSKELEAITRRENELERETAAEKEQINADHRKRVDQQGKEFEAARFEALRASLARERAAIEAAAAERLLSYEPAERALTEIINREHRLRLTQAEADVSNAIPDSTEQATAQEKVNALIEEGRALEEASLRRIGEARQKDVAALRVYIEEQKRLRQELQDVRLSQQQREADRLGREADRTGSVGTRFAAINARAEAGDQAAQLEHKRSVQRINDDRAEQLSRTTTVEQIFAVEQLFYERRLAEDRRFADARRAIYAQAQADINAANPASNLNTFGINNESLGFFDALRTAALGAFGDIAGGALNLRQVLGDVFSGLAQATQGTLQSFVLTGKGGAQAFKSLAAAVISSLAVQALVKVPFQIAEGVKEQALAAAAAATGNFGGAALHQAAAGLHFKAATLYALLGGGALGAGLAIGASGGLGGGSAAGDSLQGSAEQRRDPEESRFRFGDATGKLNDPDRAEGRNFVEVALDLIRQSQETQQRLAEETRAFQAANLAVSERGVNATEAMATRITTADPEQILTTTLERNPGITAKGVKDSLIADSGFTRTIAENLRLS